MFPIKKILCSFILIIALHFCSHAQKSKDYKYYTLSSLIKEHKDLGNELLIFLYKNITFPRSFREEEFEGSIKFYLKYDEQQGVEILYSNLPNERFNSVYDQIAALDWPLFKPVGNNLLIEIPIEFDLEPFNRRVVPKDSIVFLAYTFPIPKH